ncbi:C6 finger domain protein, putative [Cordyceps militaris CM01]|uniref:C6 finger domain protein, putative n=1 Tax=Cordyceps militaris (strain CM01) TaxID=983644 RepID=G3JJ41_CORMM|nr:C6 finger domain protein, putative [Cordyceps militaris CM01]EGX91188.1 C6 finger domain protein, putative [Cordyceps militaris CM01]
MAENYPQFLSSMMAGAEAHVPMSPEELNHPFLSGPHMPINTMPINYQNFGHFTGFPGPSFAFQPSISKGRRKSASAASADTEQVKHRRTRSGCFTCRGRRVKCDETRPICERCRKGGRDCVYPDPSTSKASSRQKESASTSASNHSPTSSNSEDLEHDDSKRSTAALDTIPYDDEQSIYPQHPLKNKLVLQISDYNSQEKYSLSPSPSKATPCDQFFSGNQESDFHSFLLGDQSLSSLPSDYQMHLQFLYENVTCHHYSLTNDTDNFFVRGMIIEASKNQLLLNAVVAFAAYLRSVEQADGELRTFLLYYNRSITLLLECLKQEQTHNLPTLLSILQLATIEEYLGDWLNLMGHQRAALELLTKLFTPQTIMETRIGQICLTWFSRFDAAMSFLRTGQSKFPRDWLTEAATYYRERINDEPTELRWRAEERLTRLHIIRYDVSVLLSSVAEGEISESKFSEQHEHITTRLIKWRDTWDPMLTAPKYAVQDYSWRPATDPDDIIDPCEPGLLYNPPLISSTIALVEWHSLMILHMSLAKTVPREKLKGDQLRHGYALCQLFEALEYWPSTPRGILSSLGIPMVLVAFVLPRDMRHRTWLWRKLALLETMGTIQTMSFRSKMANLFHDERAMRWWLPDDKGFSSMLQSIRNFADERHNVAPNGQLDYGHALGRVFGELALGGDIAR